MTEIEAINACRDPDLLKRVAFSLAKLAITKHAGTAPEIALASKISLNPEAYAQPFLITGLAALSGAALTALTPVTANIAQASIDTQMAAVFGVFTGP